MPRPGTDVIITDGSGPSAAVLDTGQAFMVGVTERGPTDEALKLVSLRRYEAAYGEREGGSLMYDAVSAYFSEGGGVLYVSRLSGPDAVPATIAFGSLTANASSPGEWGNDVTVSSVAPVTSAETLAAELAAGEGVVVVVEYQDVPVERSPVLSDADALVAWADKSSAFVRFVKGADNVIPPAGTTADLAGGVDDTTVDGDTVTAALERFDYALGPGQVLAPGLVNDEVHTAVLAHVNTAKRVAVLDAPDDADPTALGASVQALYGITGVRFASLWGPWAVYPGPVSPTTVVMPYSPIAAGLIARLDRFGNPNAAAAGADGISRLAVGLAQNYTDVQREALNEMGVCLAKPVYGDIRSYGFRTAAGPDDDNWLWFSNSRVIMAIAHECDAAGEDFVLKQIDGRGHLFSRLNARLRGICQRYYDMDALFGETPADAYDVDTGPGVNTTETIKNGEIHAIVKVKCSPAAEWVVIEVVKVPIDRAIAA
jgi:hypothetical protein